MEVTRNESRCEPIWSTHSKKDQDDRHIHLSDVGGRTLAAPAAGFCPIAELEARKMSKTRVTSVRRQ